MTTVLALKRKGEPPVISVELVLNCVIFAKDAAVRMLEAARIQMFLILLKRSQTIYVKLILLKQDKKKQLLNQKQSLWDHT